jgi:hypothetical protein
MPVPRDSALVFLPAIGSLPWGCRRVDWMASTARFIMSGLMGVAKMAGSVVLPVGFPVRSKILTVLAGGTVWSPGLFSLR